MAFPSQFVTDRAGYDEKLEAISEEIFTLA
jgi:hypothetical protein